MQTFKIKKEGFKEIKKQMLMRTIPIMLIALTAGITISSVNSKKDAGDINILPVMIPVVVLAAGVGLYRGTNRQKALFESYTLTITNNLITREQLNTPSISIYFNDIREITRHKNGNFIIKGKDTNDLIAIPSQIDNYALLETTLQNILPITAKDKVSLFQKYPVLAVLLTVGLMFSVFTINNKIVVGLTGTALIALLTWSFIKIRNSKNVDNKTKKSGWIILLILAMVIAAMVLKLTGVVNIQQHS